jgi:uncharacterized membrane protein (DUF2068 family)
MTPPSPSAPAGRRELVLRLIVLGKLVKATTAVAAGIICASMLLAGGSDHLHGLAIHLREHVTAAWSTYAAEALLSATDRRHLAVATCALLLDGTSTAVEWYALSRGRSWGEWLVVFTTSSLLPFEVVALVRHRHVGRLVVLLVNVAVVAYLAHHASGRTRGRPGGPRGLRPGRHVNGSGGAGDQPVGATR